MNDVGVPAPGLTARVAGLTSHRTDVADTSLDATAPAASPVEQSRWFPVGADSVRLLRDGEQAFPAMLEAIAGAKHEVLLEIYWIGLDAVGQRFRDALAERARAGVTVSVIYDAVGSRGLTAAWWRPVVSAGGAVMEYHSIWPFDGRFRFDRIELRDHRKLLVVDGVDGFTGGINLAAPWMSVSEGGAGWRDDMVQVRGEATQELRSLFYNTWRKVTRLPPPIDVRPLSRRHKGPIWMLASQWRSRRSIHREYLARIARARDRVDIANSYFVPDRRVRAALFGAVRRGVRVRVLVPGKGDIPVVQLAVEALFDTLLAHGVRVWMMPGRMLHAKTAVIDESFTTIGSYNLDARSRRNLEVNLAIDDHAFARHVRSWFEHDLSEAAPVDLTRWRARSRTRRGLEWAALALRRFW
jgi:cardiolipin synthase A/B